MIYASGVGGEAITWLGNKFSELRDTVSKVFKGISDALAAGDIALAGKILWLSLKVEFTKGVNALREIWIGFKEILMSAWTDAVFGLAKIFTQGVAILETIWTQFSSTIVDKWKVAEQTLAEGIAYVIAKAQGLDPAEVIGNLQEDYGRQRQAREQATQERLDDIDAQREGALAVLEEDRQRAHADRQARYGQDLDDQQRELDDLIRQRDEALAEAEKAAGNTSESDPEGLRQRLGDALSGLDLPTMVAGGDSAGTFSAFAAARMGANSTEERTAKAAEETADNTKSLLQEVVHSKFVFG